MRTVLQWTLTIVVVVIAAVAGFVGGWYLRPASTGPGSETPLGIIAAGSLSPSTLMPYFAAKYASNTSGVSAPVSAQLYEGSTDAANAIISAGSDSPYDLFVAADFRVIPQHLLVSSPAYAQGEAVFASDPMVLAYNPAALPGLNASNWAQKIVGPGILLGAPNASADPLGYNVIFTLELEDALVGAGGSLYSHFFTGKQGALASPTTNTLYVVENDAGIALSTGEVEAYLIYQSYALAEHLTFIPLSSAVNLGGQTAADASRYGAANTTILSGNVTKPTKVVVGAPVLFALTVPTNAPDPSLGNAFASWLLTNSTLGIWAADGFQLTPTVWTYDTASYAPSGSTALPSYLVALL